MKGGVVRVSGLNGSLSLENPDERRRTVIYRYPLKT